MLFIFVVLVEGYILIELTKRGPLLWAMINVAICFFYKNKNKFQYFVVLSLVAMLFLYNFDIILDGISSISPSTGERIYRSIYEGDTAKRFDLNNQAESNYILGFHQFLTSPVYGSYFRLITSNLEFRGVYPHNVFIEILMTMGMIGFIPFLIFLKRVFNNMFHYAGCMTCSQMSLFSLFLAFFFQLQTTGTIVLNMCFWILFYIAIQDYPQLVETKNPELR